jgi:hypothetical protein
MNHEPLLMLPTAMKHYTRFVCLHDPSTLVMHSYGISGVQHTDGSLRLIQQLEENRKRRKKRSVTARLCDSVVGEYCCCLGVRCLNVHVTHDVYNNRRHWQRNGRNMDNEQPVSERLMVHRRRTL